MLGFTWSITGTEKAVHFAGFKAKFSTFNPLWIGFQKKKQKNKTLW